MGLDAELLDLKAPTLKEKVNQHILQNSKGRLKRYIVKSEFHFLPLSLRYQFT